ncbi:OB-fold protein [Aquimarina litoralis]|uniref:OB-fold protein n=1 Tax=Aquimarina litoralis TaxID=584605 RepID=UPI0031DEF266
MTKKIKIATFLFISLCVLSISVYYVIFDEEHINVIATEPELHLSSRSLVASFSKNEQNANDNYKNKVVEVTGSIKEISYLNNRSTLILEGNTRSSSIICDIQPNHKMKLKKLKEGDTITIKGVCKGYLKDVILLNCVLTNQNTNE